MQLQSKELLGPGNKPHKYERTVLQKEKQILWQKVTRAIRSDDVLYTHEKVNRNQLQKQVRSYPIQKKYCE